MFRRIFKTIVLFFVLLNFSATAASGQQVSQKFIQRDLSLLYESILQIEGLMTQFHQVILPIAEKVEADENYMLTISQSMEIDQFCERFYDVRIAFHTLYASYQNNISSDDFEKNLLRVGPLVGLVYPAAVLVKRFWNSPRMIKILDGAANRQIPFGSYMSMQNEVFYQQRNLWRKSDDAKFLMLFPAYDLEGEVQRWQQFRGGLALSSSPMVVQLNKLIQLYYQSYDAERPFFSSVSNISTLWLRNAAYQFKTAFYRQFLKISTWIGDTKVKRIDPDYCNGKTLIKLADARQLETKLQTGDILTSRSNWFLSNAFLPGFWPHSFIYLGHWTTLTKYFADDAATKYYYAGVCSRMKLHCNDFVTFLQANPKTKAAWESYLQKDDHQFDHVIIEATSEGVHFSSIRHTFLNDYLGVMRPVLNKLQIAQTIENTFYHFGKEYDFYLDWASDDRIVCSELVSKSYQSDASMGKAGIDFNYSIQDKMYVEKVMGRIAIPVINLVRKAYDENVLKIRPSQFQFVAFLKGVQATDSAVYATEQDFYASRLWAKWSFMQE